MQMIWACCSYVLLFAELTYDFQVLVVVVVESFGFTSYVIMLSENRDIFISFIKHTVFLKS